MTTTIDWNTIGELAKGFKEAVDAQIKAGPASISVEKVREILGPDVSDERVNRAIESSKEIKFIEAATEDELLTLLGANLGIDADGQPSDKVAPPVENFIYIAEIYANLAERKGLSDQFKGLVPEAAKTPEVRAALAEAAPTFAKLCM
jgi:hypothetical protein